MKEPLYLVDGYGLIYRSYFAFIQRPLINSKGRNTSAVLGFFRSLLQLIRTRRPGRLAVVMDSLTPTFRHELFPQYKATRQKTPADLHDQIPIIEAVLAALAVPVVRADGFEADDVIATLAQACRAEQVPCYIYSADKDLLQLVTESTRVLQPPRGSGDFVEVGEAEVQQGRGVSPSQMVDYLALTGDSSDNVPGVKGIGDKSAVTLLQQFGTLDAVYGNLESVAPAGRRARLEAGREDAFLSRQLVTLRRDTPISVDLHSLDLSMARPDKALALLHEEEIHAFDEELGAPESPPAVEYARLERGRYACILTETDLDLWIRRAQDAGVFSLDTETDALDEMNANPIGISLAVGEGVACYIPLKAAAARCLPEELVRDRLAPLLADTRLKVVGQNVKFDYKVLRRWGLEIRNLYFDTMLSAFCLDTTRNVYSLDRLARELLSYQTIPYEDLVPRGSDFTLCEVDLAAVTDYAAEDADITLRLYRVLSARIHEAGLDDLLYGLDMPCVRILGEMELAGIKVLPEVLSEFSVELDVRLADIQRRIYTAVGHEFNIGSTKQLQEVLFEERGLAPVKKTKTGYSTDARVLEELAREDEVCALILEHRTVAKLKSTYVDTLPALINARTGRLHTHYDQTGAATGRLASTDPNLQNIPVRDDLGRRIRDAFVAQDGWTLLSADYNQIELVILASRSQDPLLMRAFREGRDVHIQTAALLFGVEETLVTREMRRIGKTINFGVIYGMSAYRLSRETGLPRSEADRFISTYFERFQGVSALIDRTIAEARERGYVQTLRGRRRPLPTINSRNRTEKAGAERIAVNTPIQGSAADIVKMAMIALERDLRTGGLRGHILLQVHDELILTVPDEEIEESRELVRRSMEGVVDLGVPLRVNVQTDKSWGTLD